MKKYKTWEIVKMLTENPRLEFKRVSDGVIFKTCLKIENGKETGRYISQITSPKGWADCVTISDEWELIQQPVDFLTAVKAYSEGKKIRCEHKEYGARVYKPSCKNSNMIDNTHSTITPDEILDGKWYVEESNE